MPNKPRKPTDLGRPPTPTRRVQPPPRQQYNERDSNAGKMPDMYDIYGGTPNATAERPKSSKIGSNVPNLQARVSSMRFESNPTLNMSMDGGASGPPSRSAPGPPSRSAPQYTPTEQDDSVYHIRRETPQPPAKSSRRTKSRERDPPPIPGVPPKADSTPAEVRSSSRPISMKGRNGSGGEPGKAGYKALERKDKQENQNRQGSAGAAGGTDLSVSTKAERKEQHSFMGLRTISYGLWAHRMSYCSAFCCLFFGAFAVAFSGSETYGCKINDKLIDSKFLYNSQGNCPTQYTAPGMQLGVDVCCNQVIEKSTLGKLSDITAYNVGILYVLYSLFIILIEDIQFGFGFGMYFPSDNWYYDNKFSPLGFLHLIIGFVGLSNLSTCIAGVCLIINGSVYLETMRRQEAGDGGREQTRKRLEKEKLAEIANKEKGGKGSEDDDDVEFECSTCPKTFHQSPLYLYMKSGAESLCELLKMNPLTQLYRVYQEDKLSAYFWVAVFILANVIMFGVTYNKWVDLIETEHQAMLDGTIDVLCDSDECNINRIAIEKGPFSKAAPLAKACGGCLNMNCAILLLPVIKLILRKMTNLAQKFQDLQDNTDYFSKFFSYSFARYVPIQKNIEFHKLVAFTVCIMTIGHIIGHYANLVYSYDITLAFFKKWGWEGTAFFTGSVILVAMFVIFSAAADIIRHTKYEIFFKAHHMFFVFYAIMFLHGPRFWYWGIVPVGLYLYDRYQQQSKGADPFMISKVEYIHPVMALYFKPCFSKDFSFKEGQYLYLSCPEISSSEWHPFTISSAQDDMINGPRVYLETGEEVLEVPRPKNLHPNAKWNKYYLISTNWKDLDPNDYIDKYDTGYNDYISCHIKIHGLDDPVAKTWTRKFKEYLETCAGNAPGTNNFPLFFKSKDHRNDIQIGQLYDQDNQRMICVDGPHSAPSEHFCNYGTSMIVGGGIGLTPCASIITSLIKHRWKQGLKNPEILHLYWVVRQGDVDSFQWLVHLLTELSYDYKKSREDNIIDEINYVEFNIFVTAVDKNPKTPMAFQKPKRKYIQSETQPLFTADKLYDLMLNPTVSSKKMVDIMKKGGLQPNRLQDVWVWNGRPDWNQIFADIADQRQHSEIGVCFCGAPVIGNDLKKMCQRYSSSKDDCIFTLHKENF
jgi:hypothetical protein